MSDEMLSELLVEARDFNLEHDITGLLLYGREHSYQILEGGTSSVQDLFGRIRQDKRHLDITLIAERDIVDRTFSNWWMGFRKLASTNLGSEPVFHEIRDAGDLATLPGQGDALFKVMSTIYASN